MLRFPSSRTLHAPFYFQILRPPPRSTLFPYTTLFRSVLTTDTTLRALETEFLKRGIAAVTFEPGLKCDGGDSRSEEHTSELQSRGHLVCRLLLEKKKKINQYEYHPDCDILCRYRATTQ